MIFMRNRILVFLLTLLRGTIALPLGNLCWQDNRCEYRLMREENRDDIDFFDTLCVSKDKEFEHFCYIGVFDDTLQTFGVINKLGDSVILPIYKSIDYYPKSCGGGTPYFLCEKQDGLADIYSIDGVRISGEESISIKNSFFPFDDGTYLVERNSSVFVFCAKDGSFCRVPFVYEDDVLVFLSGEKRYKVWSYYIDTKYRTIDMDLMDGVSKEWKY